MWGLLRWVCGGGGGGLLIGLCSWVYVCGRVQDQEWAMFVFVGLWCCGWVWNDFRQCCLVMGWILWC